MLGFILFLVTAIGYIVGGFYIIGFIRRQIVSTNPYVKPLVLSFSIALFFGLGIVGGGGDPGFALPSPILIAIPLYIWSDLGISLFMSGVIIPLLFWWVVIFILILIAYNNFPWPKSNETRVRRNAGQRNKLFNEDTSPS